MWTIVFPASGQSLSENKITVGKLERMYLSYQPSGLAPGKTYPLLIVLHGGGGNAKQTMNFCGFNLLAQRDKFIVAYPEGYKKGWHDGRIAPGVEAFQENVDDVGFIRATIEEIQSRLPVDPNRIFATGISNGAMMSLHLAHTLSDKIRAIAPVCGNIAENQSKEYRPKNPVAVLVINGTEDPLVPYDGGFVLNERSKRGKVISTDKMMEIWMTLIPSTGQPALQSIPDTDPDDGCVAERLVFPSWGSPNPIQLIRITGGGHTWPGGKQYLPKFIVGKVCKDFKAEEVIWDFFKNLGNR
ncbi:MAG TPA: PHB depolymerase family esterase [Cyclobacteriaceae bacterium]|nr:PHB depolymerase family esterase [Cyclobacteriaceae bacterium]